MMKVRCPGCSKEYRMPALAPGKSATVRCRACGSMFKLSAPAAAPAAPAPAVPTPAEAAPPPVPSPPRPAPSAAPSRVAVPPHPPAQPNPVPEPSGGAGMDLVFSVRNEAAETPAAPAPVMEAPAPEVSPASTAAETIVLIADESRPFRETLSRAVVELGSSCEIVEDGESALAFVQQRRPKLVLVNVYLRKTLGIVVCERIKAHPSLNSTKVVLIGSLFRKDRFVRGPEHLYGADDYIEEAISPEELRQRLAVLLGCAPQVAAPPASGAEPSAEASVAPEAAASAGALSVPEELERLIRIMLSDIELYNAERFQSALGGDQFIQEFKVELDEGRRMVLDRFPDLPRAEEVYRAGVERWLEKRRQAPVS